MAAAQVDEVTGGIYRISTAAWGFPITLNQFLIKGEHPALIHTGTYPLYEDVKKAVGQVLDPARLEYIVVPHFESDECRARRLGAYSIGAACCCW